MQSLVLKKKKYISYVIFVHIVFMNRFFFEIQYYVFFFVNLTKGGIAHKFNRLNFFFDLIR